MNFSNHLNFNVNLIKRKILSDDVCFTNIDNAKIKGVLIFLSDLTDKQAIGQLILKPLCDFNEKVSVKSVFSTVSSPEKTTLKGVDDAIEQILCGNAILLVDKLDTAFSFGLKFFEKRAITEPPTSTVIKGPREGFVESLPVNISLIRRRIKSPNLKFINITVGRYSKTALSICYIKGIADQNLVRKLKSKIEKIDIDALLDSSYVSKFLGEHKLGFFKQVGNTEKPDILAGKILEGRVAILLDGSPIVLTVPYLLVEDFQSPSDYYNSSFSATCARLIRTLSVLLALFLPAFFISAELFHLQLIPLSFLLTIVNSIKGIPLSPSYEMFFTLLIFEILNEASVRMPKYVGMVVSIVGGLVLGETAVTAGIISAPTLMIIALSGICLFTVPELEQTFSVLRIFFLVVAGCGGAFALLMAITLVFVYLITFESFSTPILAPFSPLIPKDLHDGLRKGFLIEQQFRPLSLKNKNKRRLKITY